MNSRLYAGTQVRVPDLPYLCCHALGLHSTKHNEENGTARMATCTYAQDFTSFSGTGSSSGSSGFGILSGQTVTVR